jgi:hypothetical protein
MAKKTETRIPTSWDELFPGRFLKSCDLRGKAVTVTIAKIHQERIDGTWELILTFREGADKRELGCNRTNGEHIRAMFGKNPTKWIGKRITLGSEQVWGWGEKVDAIRVIGSPDIPQDIRVNVDKGRLKINRVMRRTGNGSTSKGSES